MTTRRDFLLQTTAAGAAAALSPTAGLGGTATLGSLVPGGRPRGTVQTVLGPIDASRLGFTLAHEHICASSPGVWRMWPELLGGRAAFVGRAVEKLKAAKAEGVTTVVDVSTFDVGRDVRLLEEVSRKSGVNIVAATGHWIDPSMSMKARTVEELTALFTREIERGIEDTPIKAGVIKVATDREGVTPFLQKALRAAARASKATGVPIVTHSVAASRGGEKQAEIFEAERLSPAMACIGHSDETDDLEYLTALARRGYTLGMDHLWYGIQSEALPWQKRAECIKQLVDAGLGDRILLSNDWMFGLSLLPTGTMEAIERVNPDGLLFNTRKTIPYLRQIGVSQEAIRTITIDNPRRFFGAE